MASEVQQSRLWKLRYPVGNLELGAEVLAASLMAYKKGLGNELDLFGFMVKCCGQVCGSKSFVGLTQASQINPDRSLAPRKPPLVDFCGRTALTPLILAVGPC